MFGGNYFGKAYFGGAPAVQTGIALATTTAFAISAAAALSMPAPLAAAPGLSVASTAALSAPGGLFAAPTISLSSTAALRTVPTLAAAPAFAFSANAQLVAPIAAALQASPGLRVSSTANLSTGPSTTTRVNVTLNGVPVKVREGSVTIHDALNDTPNTCSLTIDAATPPVNGQRLRIMLNSDVARLLFAGALQTVVETYEGLPEQLVYPCTAIDDTTRANARLPFGVWTNVSATTIAQDLVAQFAPGFTALHVEAGLPPETLILDGTEGMNGALTQLAKLIGGYFYWEDFDLHFFQTESSDAPDPVDDSHPFLEAPAIAMTSDESQIRTRVFGKGHGEQLLASVGAGETVLPIEDATMFNPSGGRAITETQRLNYTGLLLGGVGSLVGPSVAPAVRLTPALAPSGSLTFGDHVWAYTWITAAGETTPAPLSLTVTARVYTPPTPAAPVAALSAGTTNGTVTTLVIGSTYTYKGVFTTSTGGAISLQSPASNAIVAVVSSNNPAKTRGIDVTFDVPNDAILSGGQIQLYRSENGGAWTPAGFVAIPSGLLDDPSIFTVYLTDFGSTAGATYSGSASATYAQANLTGVALGPSGTTSRKIYQTAAGGTQLKLQQTIANNTATTATASLADASLGANAPTTDTSGLSTVQGQVAAGSTTLLTAGWPFASTGWAQVGTQLVRYTGLTGNTLTGIPTSGVGALANTVRYGEHVLVAPSLTGVTGVILPLVAGAPVNIWVQRDDLAAQVAQAARDGSDGIIEYLISDERRGEASLTALCDADLAQFSGPLITVTYDTRDVRTKAGKTIVIDLASPAIHQTLTIQDVTITEIAIAPALDPRFHVSASNTRFSFEDLLRRMAATLDGN